MASVASSLENEGEREAVREAVGEASRDPGDIVTHNLVSQIDSYTPPQVRDPRPLIAKAVSKLEGTTWDWMHNGRDVNGTLELLSGGVLKAWGTSRWAVDIVGGEVVVVCENVGGCGERRLVMNAILNSFTCDHSGQRGRLKSAPTVTEAVTTTRNNFSAPGAGSWDLSGAIDFSASALIKTTQPAGTVFCKAFPRGLWQNGGDSGQGKMLFLRNGRVCFDVGWVGCVQGTSNVSDGRPHTVAVQFKGGQYHVVVDGTVEGSGLGQRKDHGGTSIKVGIAVGHAVNGSEANGDMAPAFKGAIGAVTYNTQDQVRRARRVQ